MEAMDWPPKNIVLQAFYLLVLGQRQVGKSFWSPTVPVYTHTLQWTWIISGTDLTQGVVGRSRGDRYRTDMTMKEELLQASWPWFAPKTQWSVVGSTPAGLALTSTPLNPPETMWFTQPAFVSHVDKTSGMTTGTATIYLTDMDKQITS